MTSTVQSSRSERIVAVVGTVVLEILLGCGLIFGMSVDIPARVSEQLKIFNIVAPPPPAVKKPAPRPIKNRKRAGAASPPNLKAEPTRMVAPQPIIPLPPPPIAAAKKAGPGDDLSAGAAQQPGPGTGSGGRGTGTGSGGAGEGQGGDSETPPRWRSGRIKASSDYPSDARDARAGGTVSVRYTVETDGQVTGCIVRRSSGFASLDRVTCRLIEERFRYKPALDAQGRPVTSVVEEDHSWSVDRDDGGPWAP